MAFKNNNRPFYNIILIVSLLVVLLLSVVGISGIEALALEQEVRCGITEHSHTADCYIDSVLVCGTKNHTHSSDCYLVLLADNDINWLLQVMSDDEDKSLEGVIDSALAQAITLNSNFSDAPMPVTLTSADISSLNDTIAENDIEPAVVLNENLNDTSTLVYSSEANQTAESEISVQNVGDDPSTGTRAVNFYILLDETITLIDSGTLTNSNPDYYSYSDTVAAYTGNVVTSLTTSNINSTYFFRYNTNGTTSQFSSFSSNASYQNSRVTFGNSNSARYAILSTRSGSSGRYTYSAVPFYTFTLDYSQADSTKTNEVQYVQSGLSPTLTLSDKYLWYDEDGNSVTSLSDPITERTTLYARNKAFTATFVNTTGAEIVTSISGSPENGKLSVTLPDLSTTAYEGYFWIVQGGDETVYYESTGNISVDITGDTTFVAVPNTYTVTFIDEHGTSTTLEVGYLETVTFGNLAEGYSWIDRNGNKYSAGDVSDPIVEDVVFTAAEKTISVIYDVNFPSDAEDDVDSVPTLYGTSSSAATDIVAGGTSAVLRTLTSRTARDEISSSNKESLTYFFKGWTIDGTDLLLAPDSTLLWAELETYAGEDGSVNLTGVWETASRYNSATFFVRYDSVAVDTDGNITSQDSTNYTPAIFNTHVGGVDTSWSDSDIKGAYEIADTTADNSYTADQKIRAIYGEKAEGIWLYDFPKDDDVFAFLKEDLSTNTSKQITVDGEAVDLDALDSDHYAIRWYVFKLEGSSWHIDGKLVKKEGTITVAKTFGGDEDVFDLAEEGFYIVAANGILNESGEFIPYTSDDDAFNQTVLVLDQTTADQLTSMYPDAAFQVAAADNDQAHSYIWKITGVQLGEYWKVTEYPAGVDGCSYYTEYSVYDTDGEFTAIAEYGTQASAIGKAFALDEDLDQGLFIDFQNYYYDEDSVLLKKEDAQTGNAVGGAVFEILQNDEALKFYYDEATGTYTQNPAGNTTLVETGDDGFAVINGFSYLHGGTASDGTQGGSITVAEVTAPTGYDMAPDVKLGKDQNGDVILKSLGDVDREEWSAYAEMENNEVLVIKDRPSDYISVTVSKIWNTSVPADSVEIVLQANGSNAAILFPGLTNAHVTMSEHNSWSYTWTNLPRYANGQEVSWSVKEVVIGSDATLADGTTFANWIVILIFNKTI